MNHLAHFFLAADDADLAIGNFVADFITNRELPNYTEGVKRGIFLHRAIDAFTDAHPIVKQSTKRLHPFHHKYSPVVVDVYYDFLLAKNWEKYAMRAGMDLRSFVDNIYNLLIERILDLPPKMQKRLPLMIADDWLMRYSSYEGLHNAFLRIEKVTAFPSNFSNAAKHLELFLEPFDAEFNAFFPDLLQYVVSYEFITHNSQLITHNSLKVKK